jgi:hypothetical protein
MEMRVRLCVPIGPKRRKFILPVWMHFERLDVFIIPRKFQQKQKMAPVIFIIISEFVYLKMRYCLHYIKIMPFSYV